MLRTQNYPKNKSTRWFNVGVFMGILMSLFCNPLLSTWWSGKTKLQDSNHQFVSVPAGISDWTNQENTCQTSNTKSRMIHGTHLKTEHKLMIKPWHSAKTKITKTDDKCAILLKIRLAHIQSGHHHPSAWLSLSSLLFLLKNRAEISQIRWPVVACPTWQSWRVFTGFSAGCRDPYPTKREGIDSKSASGFWVGGIWTTSFPRMGLLGPPGCVRLHFLNVCFVFFPGKEKSTTVVVRV